MQMRKPTNSTILMYINSVFAVLANTERNWIYLSCYLKSFIETFKERILWAKCLILKNSNKSFFWTDAKWKIKENEWYLYGFNLEKF